MKWLYVLMSKSQCYDNVLGIFETRDDAKKAIPICIKNLPTWKRKSDYIIRRHSFGTLENWILKRRYK